MCYGVVVIEDEEFCHGGSLYYKKMSGDYGLEEGFWCIPDHFIMLRIMVVITRLVQIRSETVFLGV